MAGYKSIPFWSWNDDLNEEELRRQIRWMRDKGIGGFFMHARSGLITEYLSKKWMQCIEVCADEAEKLGMEAWAYDENGWPSGFCGGKLLEDEENCDMYLLHNVGNYDNTAFRSYYINGNKLELCGGEKEGDYVNVYLHRSISTADILNEKVVKKFINSTHERYKNEVKSKVHGFFTDEPQYFRWHTPYTQVLPNYFFEKFGEDVNDNLGLLFFEYDGYKEYRYKYYKCLQELMVSSFAKQIYNWCEENGYKLTGHYIQEDTLQGQMLCCAGIMPFYEYEHIPGVDHLGRVVDSPLKAKQLDSVCTQLGKKHRLAEIYATVGWDATPLELKGLTDGLYATGINLTCQHLLPYSERGNRKRDYPEHFSWVNPWVEKNFEEYNDYYNKLSDILADSKPFVNVAIFHPIRSAYFDYKRIDLDNSCKKLNDNFVSVTNKYINNQIMCHYIDETLLAKYGKVENDELILGNCSYKYLVFPSIYTMDKSSYNLISKFISNGGKVLFEGEMPTYLEYLPFNYEFKSNVTFEEIKNSQPFISTVTSKVNSRLFYDEKGNLKLFVANTTANQVKFTLSGNGVNSLITYDLASNVTENTSTEVVLNGYQSKFISFSDKQYIQTETLNNLILTAPYKVIDFNENYLTLDTVKYSYDGINYFDEINVRRLFEKLLNDRYKGDLYLKYTFNCEYLPTEIFFTAENNNVTFNGNKLVNETSSRFGIGFYKYDVSSLVKLGVNEAIVKYNYYQGENVYYALFGENVTESLVNCLVYDTDIESAYVSGKFAVSGEFEKGDSENIILGKNFNIVKPEYKYVNSLIKEGFPFLSGDVTLEKTITLKDTNYKLFIDKRFNTVEIIVNGNYVKMLTVSNEVDISKYLKVGENVIKIVLTVSNRNTLGIFHNKVQEGGVNPNSWNNCERDNYSFVETLF